MASESADISVGAVVGSVVGSAVGSAAGSDVVSPHANGKVPSSYKNPVDYDNAQDERAAFKDSYFYLCALTSGYMHSKGVEAVEEEYNRLCPPRANLSAPAADGAAPVAPAADGGAS
jgi:hypothetical protein